MAHDEIAAIEAQVNALDRETAERVTHLVFECSVSLNLALLAVEDADRAESVCETKRSAVRRGLAAAFRRRLGVAVPIRSA